MLRVRHLGKKKLSSICFNNTLNSHSKFISTVPSSSVIYKQQQQRQCRSLFFNNSRYEAMGGIITQIRFHGSHQHRHGEGDEHHHVHADLVTTLQNSSKYIFSFLPLLWICHVNQQVNVL